MHYVSQLQILTHEAKITENGFASNLTCALALRKL